MGIRHTGPWFANFLCLVLRLLIFLSVFYGVTASAVRPALFCAVVLRKQIHRVALLVDETCSGQCLTQSQALLDSFGPYVQVQQVNMRNLPEKALEGFHGVIVPGGSVAAYPIVLGDTGKQTLRKFVQNGGLFIGTCAGAYLGSEGPTGMGLLPVKGESHFGKRDVGVELTGAGKNLSATGEGKVRLFYQNGPRMELQTDAPAADLEVLAYFNTDLGVLDGSIAAVKGSYGKGRVYLFSPHPELSPHHVEIFQSAVVEGLLESKDRK